MIRNVRVIREDFSEEVIFEQRPESTKGISLGHLGGRKYSGQATACAEEGAQLVRLKKSKHGTSITEDLSNGR